MKEVGTRPVGDRKDRKNFPNGTSIGGKIVSDRRKIVIFAGKKEKKR